MYFGCLGYYSIYYNVASSSGGIYRKVAVQLDEIFVLFFGEQAQNQN